MLHVRGEQLLREEWVAVRPSQDLTNEGGWCGMPEDPSKQLGQLPVTDPTKLDPLDTATAIQLREERTQRVTATQIVAAVGQHQHDARTCAAKQKGQQIPGRPVGPLKVLDD